MSPPLAQTMWEVVSPSSERARRALLMYTTIDTPDGLISMPNAGLLAAAIGPAPEPTAES